MAFWIALAVLLAAVVGGIAYVVIRGIQLWRNAKSTSRTLGAELDRISAVTEQIERHTAKAEASLGRLEEATGRLAISRAKLDVQLGAVREARTQVRRVFWFVPGV